MKEKALKINKKDYNIAKSLSDRDFGTLVRALCEYVYYGIDASPKDKILKVYYDNFKATFAVAFVSCVMLCLDILCAIIFFAYKFIMTHM